MLKETSNPRNDIAVVGMSGRFPGAKDVDAFWRNIAAGTESTHELSDAALLDAGVEPALLQQRDYVRRISPLADVGLFDAAFFDFTAREASMTAPAQRLLLMCAYEALEDASCLPQQHQGNIGVFVGANRCDEWQKRLYRLSEQMIGQTARQLQFFIANDLDYSATRISYKLNLTGPSMSISTACSTSLIAIIQACRSLLTHECDLALAGGANVVVPQDIGYLYEEGGIRSSDGRCRAFDAKADGTIFGNGAGVVLLKRLDEALASRDHIHAVIRGAAINNDGSAKVGYTAPSVTGQSQVIAAALTAADVHPEQIGYVEAHGTGTSLGDPIEIEALSKAYRAKTKKKRYCALGSVKTNIGHLGSAAGVAGFIKAVQVLKHQQIPPSLHFERANPEIDFANSPFFVSTQLKPWATNGAPRRAAVSSFGVGGANAHVILEEAPPAPVSGPSRVRQLIVLSAKSPSAVAAMSRNLAHRLEVDSTLGLADVAYSLTTGRHAFPYRRTCVAGASGQAIAALRDETAPVGKVDDVATPPRIAFMFPGQGAQHIHMGRGLYQQEKSFRDTVDACAPQLEHWIGCDLRAILFPASGEEQAMEALLRQTRIAQPALFVVEYALARLWQSWGVNPDKMIGHSIGEYVAACLAGVFSLSDALQMVAGRGRLMQSMPAGAMLAVSLGETELKPLLGECELAAVNGPNWCVASGTDNAIHALAKTLTGSDVSCRRLHTSHAFHSRMMDPMLQEYARLLAPIKLQPPKIPFLSNLTGDWIRSHQAVDAAYWVRQLRGTVQFYAGANRLFEAGRTLLFEVGPGQTLTTLVKAFQPQGDASTVLASCRQARQMQDDQAFLLQTLGHAWMAGAGVDWSGYYGDEQRRRVALPTYPFEGRHYWLESRAARPNAAEVVAIHGESGALASDSASPAPISAAALPLQLRAHAAGERNELLMAFVRQSVQFLLGTQDVCNDTALIEMGLSSLSAIELRTQLNTALGADCISVVTLLDETATISNLAALLNEKFGELSGGSAVVGAAQTGNVSSVETTDAANSQATPENAPVEFPESTLTIHPDPDNQYQPFPLTDIQQAYWIGRHGMGGGDGVATYGYVETDVHGLDAARYQQALNQLIQRHHMLRMVVREDGAQQFLRDVPLYHIPYEDLSGESEGARAKKLGQIRETMSHQILDPASWPLFQIRINRITPEVYRIHCGFDFMIVDVLSLLVFFRDQFLIYQGETKRLPPLEINFRDYVLMEKAGKNSGLYHKAKRYWLERAATLPAAPMLPFTREAAQIQAPRYARREFTLDADSWGRLKESARRFRITPSVLIATAYSEVLAQWSKSPRFTINLTIFNRPRLHPQMNDLIGDFTSSVLLEADMSGRSSFERSARRLQTQLLTDLEHRQFTGVEMLRAMNSQMGGYQAVVMPIVLTSALGLDQYAESRLAGLDAESLQTYNEMMNPAYAVSQTSQVWLDHVVREKDGVLLCNWDALEELFPQGVLDDMFCAYYDRLVELANAGNAAWQTVRVPQLPAAQQARRRQVNQTGAAVSNVLLHEAFRKIAVEMPANAAVINRALTLSYRDLHVVSTQFGALLRERGLRPNQLVAVVMHKGWEQIVAVFASLYSGAAYMPVDAALPEERIRQLLIQGDVSVALTQAHVVDEIDWPKNVQPIVIDESHIEANRLSREQPVDLPSVQTSTDLAYVLFTSGSTGAPKGVMIDHESALNTVLDINRRFAITEQDRAIAINALNFDLSVYDIFGLLSAGGALVMPDYRRALDPGHWAELVVKEGVTFWNTVPAIVQMYIEELENTLKGIPEPAHRIRWIFMSGDWIPIDLPDRIRRAIPAAQPVSLGGPTETTVWSVYYPIGKVEPEWKSIPYGKPLENRSHQILHDDLSACPEWTPGEIYTGGRIGLSKGYWKDEEKTNSTFIRHPDTGERLCRTGDWGRFLPDGDIEFLGREDKQVKVQGHRIELGEIEFALRQCDDVQDAVVLAVRDAPAAAASSNVRLVAYVVEQSLAEEEAAISMLTSGDTLTDPFEIAAFKLKQLGLRPVDAAASRVALPHAPMSTRPIVLSAAPRERAPLFSGAVIPLELWGGWLSGLGQIRLEGYSMPKYYYPSAGSAYAVQSYLCIGAKAVESIEEGLYYYDPQTHALIGVGGKGAVRAARKLFAGLGEARFALIQVANAAAVEPLYGAAAAKRCYLLEAGHIRQLLTVSGAPFNIGLANYGSVDARSVVDMLGLDQGHRFVQCMVGGAADAKVQASVQEPLTLNILARQSYRRFAQRPLARERLETLLASLTPALADISNEAAPSIYLYIKPHRVEGLAGGFYRYDLADARLALVSPAASAIANLQYTRNRKIHRQAAFSVIFAAPEAHSDQDTQSTLLLNAGYLAQAAINLSTHLGIGLCSTAGVKVDVVRPWLSSDGDPDVLYCLEGGPIGAGQMQRWVTESLQGDAEQEWREALHERLPYYMTPGAFVRLEEFPLTANGKVDRKALAALANASPAKQRQLIAPRDAIETELLTIWRKVLEMEALSVEDNLFELGGDSLTATRLLSEAGKTLGANIPLHKLFANPTLAGMAEACRQALADETGDAGKRRRAPEGERPFGPLAHSDEAAALLIADAALDPAIRPDDLSPPNVGAPQSILLTGATGFLGAYVLRELLESTSADVYCLTRPTRSSNGKKRIIDNLKKYQLWHERYLDRVVAVDGDLSKDKFIADEENYNYLRGNIDVIYHVGAQVNYARTYQDLKKTNVGGAESIIRLACRGRLKAVNFVSTKYVCFGLGKEGLRLHGEEAPVTDPSGLFIGYTQSKWVAEQLFEQARQRGVPVALLRPGQITGAIEGAVVLPDDAFHHLVRLFLSMRSRPNVGEWNDGAIDIVPVDFCARAVAAIGSQAASYGKYFHLVNPQPMPMDKFFDVLEREADGPCVKAASFMEWVENCRTHIARFPNQTVAYVLQKFFVETAQGHSIRGLFIDGNFSTANVAGALAGCGIERPRVDESLWRRYLDTFEREGKRRQETEMEIE